MIELKYKDVLFGLLGIGGWIILLISVIWGFFHNYWVIININTYNEALLDLVIVLGCLIFLLYYFIEKVKKI